MHPGIRLPFAVRPPGRTPGYSSPFTVQLSACEVGLRKLQRVKSTSRQEPLFFNPYFQCCAIDLRARHKIRERERHGANSFRTSSSPLGDQVARNASSSASGSLGRATFSVTRRSPGDFGRATPLPFNLKTVPEVDPLGTVSTTTPDGVGPPDGRTGAAGWRSPP